MRCTKDGNDDVIDNDDSEACIPSDLDDLKVVKVIRKFAQYKRFKNEIFALGKIKIEVHRSIIGNNKQTSIKKYFS